MRVHRSLLLAALLFLPAPGRAADDAMPAASPAPAPAAQAAPAVRASPFAQVTTADRSFLTQAVLDDLLGQAMGEQALGRPGSPRFAAHAALLRDAHAAQADAMRGLAVVRGVRPPAGLDADRRATLERLGSKSGPDYEVAFATAALRLHLRMVDAFQTQAREGDDPELRTAATQTMPDLMALRRASEALWREVVPVGL